MDVAFLCIFIIIIIRITMIIISAIIVIIGIIVTTISHRLHFHHLKHRRRYIQRERERKRATGDAVTQQRADKFFTFFDWVLLVRSQQTRGGRKVKGRGLSISITSRLRLAATGDCGPYGEQL